MAYSKKTRSSKRSSRKRAPKRYRKRRGDALGIARYMRSVSGDYYTQTFNAIGTWDQLMSIAGDTTTPRAWKVGAVELAGYIGLSSGYNNVRTRFDWVRLNWMTLEMTYFNEATGATSNCIIGYVPKSQFETPPGQTNASFSYLETPGAQIRLVTPQKPGCKFRLHFVQNMESYRGLSTTGYVAGNTKDLFLSTNNIQNAPASSGGWLIAYCPSLSTTTNPNAFTYSLRFSVTFAGSMATN